MDIASFAATLDATNLKLDATRDEIRLLCQEASKAHYASVCVYPGRVSFCADLLKNSTVSVCTLIAFAHGCSGFETKSEEILHAYASGAKEIDLVMDHTALRDGDDSLVTDETVRLCEVARKAKLTSKVIVETCYLNKAQKLQALNICEHAGANFIKTSTGFGSSGATVEDVRLFAANRTGSIKIKASGGIRTPNTALELLEAGADRLGVSAADNLIEALKAAIKG